MNKDYRGGDIWEEELPDDADEIKTAYAARTRQDGPDRAYEDDYVVNRGQYDPRRQEYYRRGYSGNPEDDYRRGMRTDSGVMLPYKDGARDVPGYPYDDGDPVNRGRLRRNAASCDSYEEPHRHNRRQPSPFDRQGKGLTEEEYRDSLEYDESERIRKERLRLEKERKRLAKERKRSEKEGRKGGGTGPESARESYRSAQNPYEGAGREKRASSSGWRNRREEVYRGDAPYQGASPIRDSSGRFGGSGRCPDGGDSYLDLRGGYPGDPGTRQGRQRKKRHPVRNFFLVLLLLLILMPVLWIFAQVKTMQSMGMTSDEIEQSIAGDVRDRIANGGAQGDYMNIAVLGVDSIEGSLDSGNNRSDVMVVASINRKSGGIKLMSVYRDTYLDIGGGEYEKANAAYAFGGPEQTVQMLNTNLDLDITDYGVVGFEGIARLIDAMGGIEIDVAEDEIVHLNNYQLTMSEETGLKNIPITQAGPQTLNGLQATAYCRIRYTAGNDFKRTERQREVLTKTFDKIKSDPIRLATHLNSVLPYVKTSLSIPELFSFGLKAMKFNVEQQEGFPNQDMLTVGYIGQQSCVIPVTLSSNVSWLHSELFGETDYQPSQTVQDISAHISSVSGY
jgi:LCP family protein required for cell wall assembly